MGLRELFGLDGGLRATAEQFASVRGSRSPVRQRVKSVDDPDGLVHFTPALVDMLTLFDGTTGSYGTIYRKLPPVRTVVDFIADSVASTPLKFYRRQEDGRPEDRDHRVSRLLRHPNPDITTRRLIWGTVADRAVYGRAYWLFIPGRGGAADALIPLPPYRVQPKGGDLTSPTAYELWNPGRAPVTYSKEQIIDFHGYDPEDRRIGASKLQALKAILEEEVEASRNRKGYWTNSARVGGWFFPEEAMTDAQLEVLRESLKQEHGGWQNSGKTAISPVSGRFDGSAFSPRDSEFILGRQFVLEATARIYNLPLPLLSLTTSVAYASQREHKRQLYTEVLPPWYEEITSEIELQLFPWFANTDDLYGEFTAEAKLRGDFLEQAEVLNTAIGRPWMVVSEGRNLQNLDARGEATDDELMVPVGPNFALEGMAVAAAAVPASPPVTPLQPVAASEQLRADLVRFFERQHRSVMSKAGAGAPWFHMQLWNEKLEPLLGPIHAARVNLDTLMALATEDAATVFEHAKSERASEIAAEATRQEVAR